MKRLAIPWMMALAAVESAAFAAGHHAHKIPRADPPVSQPPVPVGAAGLNDVIQLARFHRQFKPKDSFEARPSEADWDGKPFEITLPLPGGESRGNVVAFWSYKADHQVLELTAMPQLWKRWIFRDEDATHSDVSSYGYGFYLTFASRSGGSYTGANAFGATAQVEVSHDSGIGLIAAPGTTSFVDNMIASTRSIPLAPDEARQAVANGHVVVRGTLRAYEPGKIVMCGTEYESATLNDPYDVDRKICVLSVEFTDIRVLATNGIVLATWDQATPAR